MLVIEHNLDVIKTADWLIDMGPEGGSRGGGVVAEGTPEEVAAVAESYTGQFLAPLLAGREAAQPTARRAPADGDPAAASKRATGRRSAAAKSSPTKKTATKTATKTTTKKSSKKVAAKKAPSRSR